MRHVVFPLRLVVVDAPRDAHPELPVGRMEREPVLRLLALRREERLGPGKRLRSGVEAPPFHVRAEHEAHLLADLARRGRGTFHGERGLVAPLRQGEREHKRRLAAHAARHGELPPGMASGRVGGEARHALAVELPQVSLALEPAPSARPKAQSVGRHRRIRIGGEDRVVLREQLAPAQAHLRRGARAVGQDRAGVGMRANLLAGQRQPHPGDSWRRRHEEPRMRPHGTAVLVARDVEAQHAAARAVATVLRRDHHHAIVHGAEHADRLLRLRVHETHAEVRRRGYLNDLALGDHYVPPHVARHHDVEKRLRARPSRRRRRRRCGRRFGGGSGRLEAQNLPGAKLHGTGRPDRRARQQVEGLLCVERASVPVYCRRCGTVEVGEDEQPVARHSKRVSLAPRDDPEVARAVERRMRREDAVQLGYEAYHVRLRAPREVALAVDVDLLAAVPLHSVGDAPRALPAQQRRQLHPEPRVRLALVCEAVVVMRLGEVHERAVTLRALDCAGQVPFEGSAVVGLENLGIRPVEVGHGEQAVGRLYLAAEALEQEDGVGVLFADLCDDVLPRVGRNHVACVAAEAVHAYPAPEQEHVGHVGAQPVVGVVELHEVGPDDAPRPRRDESPVGFAAEPVWMVRL